MTPTQIQAFVQFASSVDVGYNEAGKEHFLREGKRYLREVVKRLGLPAGSYTISVCKGGIAVSGEIILHADTLYVQIAQSTMGPSGAMLYRSCKGQRDCTGGGNRWMSWPHLADIDTVVETLGQFVPEREEVRAA